MVMIGDEPPSPPTRELIQHLEVEVLSQGLSSISLSLRVSSLENRSTPLEKT